MKKVAGLFLLMAVTMIARSQVTVQPTLPSSGVLQKSQLWNVLLLNQGAAEVSCHVELTLRERSIGQEVLSATSSSFTLPKGSKQLSISNLSPVQYNGTSRMASRGSEDLLQVGNYIACYDIVAEDDKLGKLASECVAFDVDPLSPPQLSFPQDSTRLSIQPTQFTWIPPTPALMFEDLSYDIVFAEILPGQKPVEAIEQNASYYTEHSVRSNILNYAGSYRSFDKEKWYAWQVVAMDRNGYAAKSEVWVFKMDSVAAEAATLKSKSYLKLKQYDIGIGIAEKSKLRIDYYSFDLEYDGEIIISDLAGKEIEKSRQKIFYGQNLMTITINTSKYKEDQLYKVSITDKSGSSFSTFFKVIKD